MTIAPHAIIGAAAGSLTDNVWLAFLFGLISHFLADFTPHLEPKFWVKTEADGTKRWMIWLYIYVIVEAAVTLGIIYYFRHRPDFSLIVAGILGGLFPDFIANNPLLANKRDVVILKQIFWFHDKIHQELPDKLWPVSLAIQGLLLGGAIWFLLR